MGPAALRALRLCWCAGRSSFGKTLAVPPPGSVDPAAALARAADLRPPVTSAFSVRNGPQPAPPYLGAEPRALGSRRTLESPRASARPAGAFGGPFPSLPRPLRNWGGGGTEAEHVVVTQCGMGLCGMGVGRGEHSFQGPQPRCSPSSVILRPGKPVKRQPCPGCGPFGAGVTGGCRQSQPSPIPPRSAAKVAA